MQKLNIPTISLDWSEWHSWNDLIKDARKADGIKIPNYMPGVYEVKLAETKEEEVSDRLTIGKASDLRMRIRQALIKGKVPHSSGDDIRALGQTDYLFVRWAVTDRPSAAEEELHKLYKDSHEGKLPMFTDRT